MTDRPPPPPAAQGPPPLAPPPTGSFKLKLKLTAPPPVPGPAPAPARHAETDEQEDQLASSNDSLSSPPPQPPHPQKRTKSKDPPSTIRIVKKRKSAAPLATAPPERDPGPVPTPQPDHVDSLHTGADSDLSSYASELPPSKPAKPKKPNPPPKQRLRVVNMAPLTDAELLTAAATTSQPIAPAPVEPGPPKKKKKKSSGFGAPKKTAKKVASSSSTPTTSALVPLNEPVQLNSDAVVPAAQVEPKPLILTIKAPSGKSKGKKPSKLQAAQQSVPDPFTTSPFPPPQPRMQHNYDLGPPPPPPVPAFRATTVGPMPRSQGPFLPAQSLDKRTPKVRCWNKTRREVVGVSGIPFWVWTYAGDDHSDYILSKQNKQINVVGNGTPINSQIHQQTGVLPYFQHQHPGSTSSSSKPSPIRHGSGRSHKHGTTAGSEVNSTANLGGPNLPASFRSRSLLAGGASNLTTDVTSFSTTSPLIARTKRDWDHHQQHQEEKNLSRSTSDVGATLLLTGHHQVLTNNGSVGSTSSVGLGNGNGLIDDLQGINNNNSVPSSSTGVIKLPELSIPPNGSL